MNSVVFYFYEVNEKIWKLLYNKYGQKNIEKSIKKFQIYIIEKLILTLLKNFNRIIIRNLTIRILICIFMR